MTLTRSNELRPTPTIDKIETKKRENIVLGTYYP